MVVSQGDVFWADFGEPIGSQPGFIRPVVVVQSDAFNLSDISTIVVVPITSNLGLGRFPGNVLLSAKSTGLPKDSVANVSQVTTVDRRQLQRRVGALSRAKRTAVLDGISIVLGR
jgi:mRNA interferase MazF